MSFAGEVRDELYEGVPKKSCCRRALAAGLLLGAETEDKTVTVRFPSEACADYAEEVFRTQFGRGLTFARRPLPRGSRLSVFSSPAAAVRAVPRRFCTGHSCRQGRSTIRTSPFIWSFSCAFPRICRSLRRFWRDAVTRRGSLRAGTGRGFTTRTDLRLRICSRFAARGGLQWS